MYPHERSLVKRLADQPFALIGINSDEDLEALRPRLAAEEITWRSYWNGPKGTMGPIAGKWNVHSWPTIYVIDAKGVIRDKNKRGEQLDQVVDKLLAEMGEQPAVPKDESGAGGKKGD